MQTIRHMLVTLLLLTLALTAGCACRSPRSEAVYQVSTIEALLEGVYDGTTTFGELKKHGDFGLGTFHALDGEMVALNGSFYQVKADGAVRAVSDETTTPFSTVMFFSPEQRFSLSAVEDMNSLMRHLDVALPLKNVFHAIMIEGTFPYIRTRSVPAQLKPYPGLTEAVRRQTVFEFRNVPGTIIGFRTPEYAKGINLPGYHFHFISADRTRGGHLLDCRIDEAAAAFDGAYQLQLTIPRDGDFHRSNLGRDRARDLEKAER